MKLLLVAAIISWFYHPPSVLSARSSLASLNEEKTHFLNLHPGYSTAPLLVTASLYQFCETRKTAQLALLLLSTALLLYAFAYFISDRYRFLFTITCAFTRTLEGLGTGGTTTEILSLLSNPFTEDRGKALF